MRRKDCVNESRLSQPSLAYTKASRVSTAKPKDINASQEKRAHTDDDDIELKSTLQELVLNLVCDSVETNVSCRANFFNLCCGHGECTEIGLGLEVEDEGQGTARKEAEETSRRDDDDERVNRIK
jgi:hypothetical protein